MKIFYLFFNLIFIGVTAVFGWLHYHYREHNKVKVVTETLVELPNQVKTKRKLSRPEVKLSVIGGLFNRDRARLDEEENGDAVEVRAATLPLILTGIMRFGSGGGAMIRPAEGSKFKKVSSKNKSKVMKKYFRVGDAVYMNYTLAEIGDDYVKLTNGTSEATLTLENKKSLTSKKAESDEKVKFSVRPVE